MSGNFISNNTLSSSMNNSLLKLDKDKNGAIKINEIKSIDKNQDGKLSSQELLILE